ncbi:MULTISPECIES: efflux RND transporter periplasmic adaptor subunit [unclassified Meiothermus]|uniref:efflux RND transporter periplasmic adaptor subunit n=1 Tax=unclassified Meiothermus TaxID=370471 RepID=UPI000D7D1EB8|nr:MULTISPECIES: efflux RND transporter periplasmic adaptor subunit [unclassified Meiothermus]PZA08504.1 efflux RND transporter periplasmic adaptor subunit [Meiothermus sp. Pnk-1]RYM36890.1 efflux RND transporter periplasmic adaptor subunit [Meiothermus sp. PNK-Is4]
MSAAQIKRSRNRRWSWGRWLLLLIVLAGIGTAIVLLRHPATGQGQAKSGLETAPVTQGTFRVSVSGPGTLAAHQSVDLKAQVQGTIIYLPKVGDHVNKGQLVVQIDPTSYQRAVDNARLALQKAQAQLESTRATQATALASQRQAIASAEAAYTSAQTQLETARANLAATQRVYAAGGATQQELSSAQRAVEQAQAQLDSARVALETARSSLALKEASNAQDLRNLQLAVDQAALSLKNAQQDLANTKIYAPFSGTVSAVNAQVGGVGVSASVSGSSALLTIIDSSSVDLPVQIDETEIGQVRVGQKVDVTLDAFNNEVFHGTVTAISPSATVVSNIAVFYVTVNVPNPDGRLRPGMTAEGEILIQEIPDALIIPKRAVQTVRKRAYVEVLKPDGSTETVRVELGPDDGTNQVVVSGLQAGQTVILPARASTTSTSSSSSRNGPGGLRIPLGGGR